MKLDMTQEQKYSIEYGSVPFFPHDNNNNNKNPRYKIQSYGLNIAVYLQKLEMKKKDKSIFIQR